MKTRITKSVVGYTPMGNFQTYEKRQGQRGGKTVVKESKVIANNKTKKLDTNMKSRTVIKQNGPMFKTKTVTKPEVGNPISKLINRKVSRGVGVPAGVTVKVKK